MKRKRTKKETLKEKLWDTFSIYIRKRDNATCYTCGKRVWDEELGEWTIKGLQAGHFKHGVLDFDEMNIHAQCIKCNHFNSGELDIYAENLIRDHGLKKFKDLCNRASKATGGEIYEIEWLEKKIAYYQQKILSL